MYNTESMDQPSSAPHPTNSASSYETEKSVVPATGGLEPVPDHHNFPEAVVPYRFQGTNEALPPAGQSNGSGSMVCGLRRPTFILTVLLAAVVVIAAVAGGVGGSIAVKQAYECEIPTPIAIVVSCTDHAKPRCCRSLLWTYHRPIHFRPR